MRKLKNLLIIVLALLLSIGLFSCKKNNEEEQGETTPTVAPISFLDYSVIRPEKVSDMLLDGVSDMYIKLTSLSGKDNTLASDYLDKDQTADSEAKEILIGHTNRPETEQVLSQLAGNEYAVAVVGNKIVITGIADSLTPIALDYFVSTYLGDGADGMIEGDLFHKASTDTAILVDKGEPIYTLVRSYTEKNEGMIDMCYQVSDAIEKASGGVLLPITTDRLNSGESHDDNAYEILFGEVNYTQTADMKPNVDPDSYNVGFVGNKIVIYAWNVEGMEKAVEAFANMLTYASYTDADGKTTVCIPKDSIIGKNDSVNFYMDIPFDVNGRRYDSVYNCSDGGMMLYWSSSDEAGFTAYAKAVEGMGYTKHQELNNDSIHSSTYYKDKASVHVYYLKRTNELRVTTQDNAILPVNSYKYTEICKPAVTQMGLFHDANAYTGMSYLIRLADGTFVVIDGGKNHKTNAKDLYDEMVKQKPEGVDDIVISAWILSHGHGDHWEVLNQFIQNYNDKVTVKMLIGNDPSDYIYTSVRDGFNRNFKFTSVNGKFGGCVYMKAHTGQQFFFPGATFTVMYTHEDMYPIPMDGFNDVSLVVDAVIPGEIVEEPVKSGETRFIWLADIEAPAAEVMDAMYDTDMKCDVLQMAHHGLGGGNYNLYVLCSPSIAFWPGGQVCVDKYSGLSQNKYLIDTVDQMIIHKDGTYTIWFTEKIDMGGIQGSEGEGTYTENY